MKKIIKNKLKKHSKIVQGLLVGIVVSIIASIIYLSGLMGNIENFTADWRRINFSSGKSSNKIVYVKIDQKSLSTIAENQGITWPWPRQAYAYILKYLKKAGAKAAVFDMLFTEFSRAGVEDDKIFAAEITNFGSVYFGVNFTPSKIKKRASNGSKSLATSSPLEKFALDVKLKGKHAPIIIKDHVQPPYSIYIPAVKNVGDTDLLSDKDGISRRIKLIFKSQDKFYANLGIPPILDYFDSKKIIISDSKFIIKTKKAKSIQAPLDKNGNFLLKFYNEFSKYKSVPAFELIWIKTKHDEMPNESLNSAAKSINIKLDSKIFKDKIVIIGSTAPGLFDLRPNPFFKKDPGMHLYGTLIDNFIQSDFISEIDNPILTIIIILILSVITGLAGAKFSVLKGTIITVAIALVYISISISLFYFSNNLIDMATIIASIISAFLVGTLVNYFIENRQKSFIKGAFSQFVAPAIVDKLMADPSRLGLGGEEKELTIFFSDLQGFTTFSEKLGSAHKLVQILNKYLTAMSDIIYGLDGYVDKYEGDAIMAFWGAPVDDENHAWKACYAALDNQIRLNELQEEFRKMGLQSDLKVRIGLNTGLAVAGNIGSEKKLNYTIMGDPVNLASRLEGANKQYGTFTMISESTLIKARDKIEVRTIDKLTVKGKSEPTQVFELMARKGELSSQMIEFRDTYETGIKFYQAMEFEKAISRFEEALKIQPNDALAGKVYIPRCQEFLKNPPSQPWDGVFKLTSK